MPKCNQQIPFSELIIPRNRQTVFFWSLSSSTWPSMRKAKKTCLLAGVLSCEVLVITSMCSSYFCSFLKIPKRRIFPRQHPTKRRTHDSKSLRVFLILAERGNFTCSMQVSPMFWVTGGISCAAQVKSCTDTGNCVLSGCTTVHGDWRLEQICHVFIISKLAGNLILSAN